MEQSGLSWTFFFLPSSKASSKMAGPEQGPRRAGADAEPEHTGPSGRRATRPPGRRPLTQGGGAQKPSPKGTETRTTTHRFQSPLLPAPAVPNPDSHMEKNKRAAKGKKLCPRKRKELTWGEKASPARAARDTARTVALFLSDRRVPCSLCLLRYLHPNSHHATGVPFTFCTGLKGPPQIPVYPEPRLWP